MSRVRRWRRNGLLMVLALWCVAGSARTGDDGVAPASSAGASPLPELNLAQQQAAGIRIASPVAAAPPRRERAFGEVLDPKRFAADSGALTVARSAAGAADAEVARLRALYRADTSASLKALQAAEVAQQRARAALTVAHDRLVLHWGVLARESAAQRRRLADRLIAGRSALIRADLPGVHSVGSVPFRALIDVDGAKWPARVLGVFPQGGEALSSAALLLQADRPPVGLAPGARLPVQLEGASRPGMAVPRSALLYGEDGTYVYVELPGRTADGRTRFAPKTVELLQPTDDGWLVHGLRASDRVVVRGAGALWSLQGLGSVDESDED